MSALRIILRRLEDLHADHRRIRLHRALVDTHADAGRHDVTILDVATGEDFLAKCEGRVKAAESSLASWAQVMDAVATSRPDQIIHGGAVLPPASESAPQGAYEVNINGSYHMLEAARLFGVARVVYASSVALYGPDAPQDVVPNDFAQYPTGMYGVNKLCTERLGEYYHQRFGEDFRAIRFPPIFGLGRTASSGWTAFTSVAVEESALGWPYYAMRVSPETRTGALYIRDAARSLADVAAADGSRLTTRCYSLHGFVVTAPELADAILRHVPDARLTSGRMSRSLPSSGLFPRSWTTASPGWTGTGNRSTGWMMSAPTS